MTSNRIRASFTDETIRVYQAYAPEIAQPALAAQRLVAPFSMTRMTWIKPSFFWMMHRCGWAGKPGQAVVLGIDISRTGFEWALANAVLSTFDPDVHGSRDAWRTLLSDRPVRIQWDPDRDVALDKLDFRAIQIGLEGQAVQHYVDRWIRRIEDVTPLAHDIAKRVADGKCQEAMALAPAEIFYPVGGEKFPGIGLAKTSG